MLAIQAAIDIRQGTNDAEISRYELVPIHQSLSLFHIFDFASDCPSCDRTLTQNFPLFRNRSLCCDDLFMQSSNVGGVSVTLHMAVATKPPLPDGPIVVIKLVAPQTRDIASRKAGRRTSAPVTFFCNVMIATAQRGKHP